MERTSEPNHSIKNDWASKKPIKGAQLPGSLIESTMTKLDDDARKILEGKNFIFLATVNPDGSPQVTPTWVDTDGHYILINTAVGRVKHRNVKKNPQVALAITEQGNPYKLVMIRGRVIEQVTGAVAESHIDKMAKKYTGADKYQNRRPGEKRVLLKIEPHHVSRMR